MRFASLFLFRYYAELKMMELSSRRRDVLRRHKQAEPNVDREEGKKENENILLGRETE